MRFEANNPVRGCRENTCRATDSSKKREHARFYAYRMLDLARPTRAAACEVRLEWPLEHELVFLFLFPYFLPPPPEVAKGPFSAD
jgi:hypothetical protein